MTRLPRMAGWLDHGASEDALYPDLYCPHGHRIPWDGAFLEAGYPRCKHKERDGRSSCDARLFVVIYPRVNKLSRPMVYVAEITYEEIQHMTREGLDVPAIMSYLEITWAPSRRAG